MTPSGFSIFRASSLLLVLFHVITAVNAIPASATTTDDNPITLPDAKRFNFTGSTKILQHDQARARHLLTQGAARLGTGTFSSVYKARDLHYHDKWYNTPWHGNHPPSSSAYYQSVPFPSGSKVYVAVKRIYVTSSPERIRNEISILDDCKSCRHVSQLITAFRKDDQVVVIMPYQKNDDFRVSEFLNIPSCKAFNVL